MKTKKPPGQRTGRAAGKLKLLHQQHLARALDGRGHAALIVRGQPGVFARQDAALISHKLLEQVGVLEIEGVNGEVNLRLRTWRTVLACAMAALVGFLGIGLAWHTYLISL